jgi:DNA-binding XRE family transcriptional regulator
MATAHPTAAAADPPLQLLRFREPEVADARAVACRFGANLVRERRTAGLSQEALGLLASLHRTEIGLLEHGRRTPRIDTLVKLADSLGAELDALLDGIGWRVGGDMPGQFVTGGGR